MADAAEAEDRIEQVKPVYIQDNVFVHTSVPASTHFDNIIRGKVKIFEKDDGAYIDWSPDKDLPSDLEYEVKSFLSGEHEWGVVSTQPASQAPTSKKSEREDACSYRINFKVTKLLSIRRSDPKLAWPYAVFILKDGTTQPALHFHSGGITGMISRLQRYIWLTRSSANSKLYVVEDVNKALGKPLSELKLFNDEPEDTISKWWNHASGTFQQFSKVTRYLMDTIGQQGGLEDYRPSPPEETRTCPVRSVSDGFEMLSDKEPNIVPGVMTKRGQCLQPEEWCRLVDDKGRILDHERLKERIFRGGIHEDIRREAWKFILGYFPFNSTYEDRSKIREEKSEEYMVMKRQWQTMSEHQIKRFAEFSSRKQLVYKDSIRTDKIHPYFEGDNNLNTQKLYEILMTYCMYNFDLGYVQGMSDLLSPILLLMEDEVDTFWCFCGLMDREANNFEIMQHSMQRQLENLSALTKYFYPQFHQYLEAKESGNFFFCFRWLLLTFKREFSFEQTMLLWEVLWAQKLTPHFKLFFALAILEEQKDHMVANNYGFNEILKHINDLSYKIDLPKMLERAESLVLHVRKSKDVPDEIMLLSKYPEGESLEGLGTTRTNGCADSQKRKTENKTDQTGNSKSCVLPPNDELKHNVDLEGIEEPSDEVVELSKDTKSVF